MNKKMNQIVLKAENFAGLYTRLGGEFFDGYTRKLSELLINEVCNILVEKGYEEPENAEEVKGALKNDLGVTEVY